MIKGSLWKRRGTVLAEGSGGQTPKNLGGNGTIVLNDRGDLRVRKRKEENEKTACFGEKNWEKVQSSNGRKIRFHSGLENSLKSDQGGCERPGVMVEISGVAMLNLCIILMVLLTTKQAPVFVKDSQAGHCFSSKVRRNRELGPETWTHRQRCGK